MDMEIHNFQYADAYINERFFISFLNLFEKKT